MVRELGLDRLGERFIRHLNSLNPLRHVILSVFFNLFVLFRLYNSNHTRRSYAVMYMYQVHLFRENPFGQFRGNSYYVIHRIFNFVIFNFLINALNINWKLEIKNWKLSLLQR